MADPGRIAIAPDGSLLPDEDAQKQLSTHAGQYHLQRGPDRTLWLCPSGTDAPEIALAGEFGGAIGAPDVVTILAQFGLRGELTISDLDIVRRFKVEKGALRAVATNAPSERLGAMMVNARILTATQLYACLSEMRAPARLGEVALERGLVNEQRLFDLLRRQAAQTFLNGIMSTRGRYTFSPIPDDETFDMPFSVHIPLQGLLMESLQRIDEMQVFRERIPGSHVRPRPRPGADPHGAAQSLRPVAELANGHNSLDDIGRHLELDEYETTRRVYQLLRLGVLTLDAEHVAQDTGLGGLVDRFNGALSAIALELDKRGADLDLGATLARCTRDASHAVLLDGALLPDGCLATDHLLKQLQAVPLERRQTALTEALHDLISFALFSAGRALPRDVESALNQRVQRMLMGPVDGA